MGDDKPFACNALGCGMRFTNEDHLTVHRKKHEMCLTLNVENESGKSSNISLFVDQTPTPTRFIRNCEEVGLFQDLQNMNPFEEHFRKATEASKTGHPPVHSSLRVTTPDSDILNTPSILASDLENDSRQHHLHAASGLAESDNSECAEAVLDRHGGRVDEEDDGRGSAGLLNLQDAEEDEETAAEIERRQNGSVVEGDDSATSSSYIAASLSPTMSPASAGSRVNAASGGECTVLTQSNMTPICFGMGESSELSILPTTESFPCEFISMPGHPKDTMVSFPNAVFSMSSSGMGASEFVSVAPIFSSAPSVQATSVITPTRKIVKQVVPRLLPQVATNTGTTMLQLIVRLPDGSSVPVNIPSLPAVTNAAPMSMTQVSAPVMSRVQDTHSKNTASFAKLKLRQSLIQSQGGDSNDPVMKLISERQILTSSDCLNFDSASNDSDSHASFSSKRQRLEEDDEEKRKRFLERNRAAATRCRQKRKQWVQSLEGKADELSGVNQQLQNEVAMLRNEVAHLKSMLLAHKDCPVTQQQQKKMTHRNGTPAGSTVIVSNPASTADILHLSAAEAIASSALTNLSQSADGSVAAAPSGSQSPVILHTFMSREQAVALLNFTGSPAAAKNVAATARRTGTNATATRVISRVVAPVDGEAG